MSSVLIVDDTADNRKLLACNLEDEGYVVTTAANGLEAIEAAAAEHPDVILMDIVMPVLDGIEACRRLKADPALRDIPVIMASCKGEQDDVIRGLDAGALDYITKPINWPVAAARIRAAIRIKTAHDTIARMNESLAETTTQLQAALPQVATKNKRLSELYDTAHEFVDNVSHEFRTPLTVISEFTSIVRDELAGPVTEEQREFLAIVLNRVDDLSNMVDDLLDVSRLEAGILPVRRYDCRIEEIVESVRPVLERKAVAGKVTLEIAVDDALPDVYCDPEKIGRVLINLVVNGIKFCQESGQVRVEAHVAPDASEILVQVRDTGPGIAPENLTTIFERFRQVGGAVRTSTKGFGLGLNIVKELVQLNFGTITVESKVGEGSVFSFSVPVANPTTLVVRYLAQAGIMQRGSGNVSLVTAAVEPLGEKETVGEVDQFLQSQTHGTDMVFRSDRRRWLLVLPGTESERDDRLAQLEAARQDVNRDRPTGMIPAIHLNAIGTWWIPSEQSDFLERFEEEIQAKEVAHV